MSLVLGDPDSTYWRWKAIPYGAFGFFVVDGRVAPPVEVVGDKNNVRDNERDPLGVLGGALVIGDVVLGRRRLRGLGVAGA